MVTMLFHTTILVIFLLMIRDTTGKKPELFLPIFYGKGYPVLIWRLTCLTKAPIWNTALIGTGETSKSWDIEAAKTIVVTGMPLALIFVCFPLMRLDCSAVHGLPGFTGMTGKSLWMQPAGIILAAWIPLVAKQIPNDLRCMVSWNGH